jgi:hypothetical protein
MKLGFPDASQTSATFGGSGGNSFNDSDVLSPSANSGPIRQIFIRAGSIVDSIGVGYNNGTRFNHGTSVGGTAHIITLADDEHILEVRGRAGSTLDQVTFISNKANYGPYGGGGGSPFSVNFSGCALQYFFGRANECVDQIGFGYGRPLATSSSNAISRVNAVGGTGGNPFDDLAQNGTLLGKISGITIRHGQGIDNIAVQYKGGPKPAHGGDGGTIAEFAIDEDEWITEVRGRAGTRLDAVQFVLSSGRMSPEYGGTGGAPFTLKNRGCVVVGFFGRASVLVDQLGVCFSDAKPKKLTISSVDFDFDNFHLNETPRALRSNVVLNKTTSAQTTSSTLTDQVTESETISVTTTLGYNIEVAMEKGFTPVFKMSMKVGHSFQKVNTTAHTVSNTRTISHQINTVVAPGKSVKATAVVTEGAYDVPWTAQGVMTYVDGTVSEKITVHGILTGVQCYGQSVVYEDL